MKIYYQLNNNDCGIAVTQSLIYHFFKKEITKEELYQEANIKEEGISILDLEKLNFKYGIVLKSYSMTFQEFLNYKTKDYFLLVINREGEQHYSIAKKNNKHLILFDPYLGKLKFNHEDFQKFWMDIFIAVECKYPKKIFSREQFLIKKDELDIGKAIIIFCINSLVLFLSILNSYLSKYSINHVYNNYDFSNLLKILLINFLLLGIFYGGQMVESWCIFSQKNQLTRKLFKNLISSLKNKKNSYFQKLGKNQFLMIRNHVHCIASYHSEYLNRWFTSIFTFFVISLILIGISSYFLIFIFVSLVIQFLFWNISRDIYFNYLPRLNESQNEGRRIINSLEQFLKLEANAEKLNKLINLSNGKLQEETQIHESLFFKQSKFSKLNTFLNHALYLFVFAFVAFYVFSGTWTIGHLISISLFHHSLNKSIENLVRYYSFKPMYLYSKNIYSQLLNVDSFNEFKEETFFLIPKKINIRNLFYASRGKIIFQNLNLEINPNTIICGPSGSGKTVLYKLMIQKLIPSRESIYFDDVPISEIKPNYFRDMCIYQGSNSYIDTDYFKLQEIFLSLPKNLQNEIFNICNIMNLDLLNANLNFEGLSSGQRQLINILNLLNLKNRLLFLDEAASHINVQARIMVYEKLIPYLCTSNFVVCSEHSPEIFQFFSNRIDLC